MSRGVLLGTALKNQVKLRLRFPFYFFKRLQDLCNFVQLPGAVCCTPRPNGFLVVGAPSAAKFTDTVSCAPCPARALVLSTWCAVLLSWV